MLAMRLDPYIVNTLMRGGWPDKPCFYRVLEPWVGEREQATVPSING